MQAQDRATIGARKRPCGSFFRTASKKSMVIPPREAHHRRMQMPGWIARGAAVAGLVSCASQATTGLPARTAAEQAKADRYVARFEQKLAEVPDDAGIRYGLCEAYDDAGRVPDALKCLEGLDLRGWPVSIRAMDFRPTREDPQFATLLRRSDARAIRVDGSRVAFTAPAELVPENVAFDPKTGAFFLGSIPLRKIVRVVDGRVQVFSKAGVAPPLLSIVGMKVDSERRTLWAASEGKRGAEKALSELLLFDVDTGELLHRFAAGDGKPHMFNDVVITRTEDVFVSDTLGGGIYRVSNRGSLRPFVPAGTFPHANGIALSRDEKKLFVAYDLGIAVIDVATGAHVELRNDSSSSIAGIDGLYVHRDGLVAVQNGTGLARIVRISLDSEATRATRVAILESGNPWFNRAGGTAPTTGVLVGDRFYYIANYRPGAPRPGEKPPAEPLEDVRVLSIPLAP
ncbi:tetratricopeptide repeat protein [Pendulispora albinea]|uniref:Tetratricopeptide repeat protein n=1 Tax=Pendulispora albinea TaxID=2741071 RepID=A0ABZ2LQA0_9BACT